MNTEFDLIDKLFDELFPIMRSITGPGIEKSLDIFKEYMPLEITKVSSGEKVFDWTVPKEWHFHDAKLIDSEGEIVCDAKENNLHLMNYSIPVDKELDLEELQNHLHSIPNLPEAIPYVTSYYKKNWGFCISHNLREKLKRGNYKVKIDTEFVDGGVPFGECYINGDSKKEILLTSYLCHPSLANNELSGPLGLLLLYNRILKWDKRRFTYRFLLNPETIGSLCFLYKNGRELKENLVSGLTLTCIGGPSKTLNFKSTRIENSLINNVVNYKNKNIGMDVKVSLFDPQSGSDERQFCSPGFNLPMANISRTKYGEYDGYHNSLDNKEFMNLNNVIESVDSIERILKYLEVCGNPINQCPFGEVQLSKHDLYPNINSPLLRGNSSDNVIDSREQLNRILSILNLSDGTNSLIDISNKLNCSVDDCLSIIEILEKKDIIKYNIKVPKL